MQGEVESKSLEPPLEVIRSNLKRSNIALSAGPARINRIDVTEKRVGNPRGSSFLARYRNQRKDNVR